MDTLAWVSNRLPEDHGFSPEYIQAVLDDPDGANGVKELAVAELLEELASQDRYRTVSIGNTSHSDPLLMERAQIWRSRAPVSDIPSGTGPGSISFIPILGRTAPTYDEYGGGAE